ncbi:hypothetical protein BJX64DRAFT_247276 [Aspergillus heterothallicus]
MADDKAPSAPAPSSPAGGIPSPTSKETAQRRLVAALRAADRINGRLNKIMSSAGGQERVFAFIQYTSHALHHILASAPWIALQTRLGLLTRLRASSKAISPSTPQTSPLLALSSLMSEARYMLRLLGLFPLLAWGTDTLKSPPSDPILHALTVLQVISNLIYQVLENFAFLSNKGVVSKRFINRWGGSGKWDLWSTRAWFGHIFLQYFVLWRARELRRKAEGEGVSKEKQAVLSAEVRAWKKSLVNNACWTPLCLHWSLEKGIGFPSHLTGFVSFLAGAWGFYDIWNSTA